MNALSRLYEKIIQRVNINLREMDFDADAYSTGLIRPEQMSRFYAFYGITPDHPLNLTFANSGLAGSYFLGKCQVQNSLLYKSDIRGDELKRQGDVFKAGDFEMDLDDEMIDIRYSALVKTLVHNYSHDPESPDVFFIRDTLAMDYSNIHGAPTNGAFLGPFATVDLTTVRDCVIGTYSYVQAGEISHMLIAPGTVWVNVPGAFNFYFRHNPEVLREYAGVVAGDMPHGFLFDFIEQYEEDFQRVFDMVNIEEIDFVPDSASVDRYAVVQKKISIAENVLVAQRAYVRNTSLGKGANVQENCYIINSSLAGFNVTAHGAKIVEADLEENVFVGFNSFIQGRSGARVHIGGGCIVMPHTIIDVETSLDIPEDTLVWGSIRTPGELAENSISFERLIQVRNSFTRGNLHFEGDGRAFYKAFKDRIHHILEVNGAFFDGEKNKGHAQRNQNLSLNTIQPFLFGEMEGMYPNITIEL